ncbi:MAG TPA: PspC domain-containing protein [Candidatus Paceibacterota bacterium]|nr:PspC domain-containing protein [Candidatus Paceibacterota bacterium]
MHHRKFRKMKDHRAVSGVCAGLAYWIGAPVWMVRLVWVASVLFWGTGGGIYLLLAIFMPTWEKDPEDFDQVTKG